jgi:uncharacterized membrane protein YphA (DoxX/SURF4 family)
MNEMAAATVEVDVALSVISIGMGVAFVTAGAMKLVFSKKRLVRAGAGWVDKLSSGTVRFVGATELMGGLALILPAVLDIPPRSVLTIGATGLVVVMLGAAVVHAQRREPGMIALNVALLALAVVAIWGRKY